MIKALFFGKLSDITGQFEKAFELPAHVATTDDLRALLDREFGAEGALLEPSVRLAINNEIVSDPHPLIAGDEVAFMPPVGGG